MAHVALKLHVAVAPYAAIAVMSVARPAHAAHRANIAAIVRYEKAAASVRDAVEG